MVLEARRLQQRPARVDERGRYRCWRCGSVLGDGPVAPGTSLSLNCKCDAAVRNRLTSDVAVRQTATEPV
jgi:hypothetical protein